MHRQWQYQIKAQPVLPPEFKPHIIWLDWYTQASEPVRTIPRQYPFGETRVEIITPVILFDWWIQASEPTTSRRQYRPEGQIVHPVRWLWYEWYQQYPEPITVIRRPEGITVWPTEWLFWGWHEQTPEPIWIIQIPEGVIAYSVEWLFWGWYEQLPGPTREELYNYLIQTMAETYFRQLFMQARDYLGF